MGAESYEYGLFVSSDAEECRTTLLCLLVPFSTLLSLAGLTATFLFVMTTPTTEGTREVRELKLLQDENARLKKLVAELSLDKAILQDVNSKKWPGPR